MTRLYKYNIILQPNERFHHCDGLVLHNYTGQILEVEVFSLKPEKPWWETLAEGYNYEHRGRMVCSGDDC